MDLYLVPLRLVLTGKVKLKFRIPFCCTISKTLWRKDIWSYSSPLVDKSPLFHLGSKEKDPDPPEFHQVSGKATGVSLRIFIYQSTLPGCEEWIEKSVRESLFGIRRLCRVMPNSDPEGRIFFIRIKQRC